MVEDNLIATTTVQKPLSRLLSDAERDDRESEIMLDMLEHRRARSLARPNLPPPLKTD
jgi:hypothetical protein